MVKVSPHCAITGVIYYHLEVCSSLPNCRRINNIIDSVAPSICQASELPWLSLGVRPLRMSNPVSQHRSRSSQPQPLTLVLWFCRLATTLGCSISASSGAYNSSQRSLVSMVFSSTTVRALKSLSIVLCPLKFELQQYLLPGLKQRFHSRVWSQ